MNLKQSSLSLIETVSRIEEITMKLLERKSQLQKEIDCSNLNLTTLGNIRKEKLEKVQKILENINDFTRERKRVYCQTKNIVENTVLEISEDWDQQRMQVPHHNFTYVMNNPQIFGTLGERINEFEEEVEKGRSKRQEQTRTIKIRISLAEIQLRQLMNRNKKL